MSAAVTHRALFVTGTDTGIGKSVASAALLHAFRARGLRAVGMKPVASGCEWLQGGWRNEDALALQAASDPTPDYDDINPYALEHPLAPELAAADAGISIALPPIVAAYARLRAQADVVVVEGVGGWMAPLTAQLDQATLVNELGLSVVLVVGLRLGCINHARLTARAIQADGLHLAGWIANEVDPSMARRDDNVEILRRVLPAPCWGRLPHAAQIDPARMAAGLSPGP
ncbi:dethiobiotin synthase [Agrilutibacter solisilvae]|uniref:ATP-dependent dethiobiotin synthetase BioD n=1 Tax=Agrilutibacter solisilvae TaxID=2763317 RepID=A0A974Y2L2_9GAMM|nr:dethiobiotin synthase [Lysobacter solisilvae]QSX79428.1 dethiobiotin synthase [Lysobacter solisilvae]